ncbi:MAG TPA: DUF2934 domain-containing protein [Terriglobia bacterium]|nr:DUF2934 domain-containing protein [Terriglobia bacterium]
MPLTSELRECVLSNETVRAWISKRAYELHQLGGYEHGRATEDWSNAESELLALASLFEEVFSSRFLAQQAIDKRRNEAISPKRQPRRTRSTSALPSESPPITNENLEDNPAKPKQELTKKRKPR